MESITLYVDQTSFELRDTPASASWVLGLNVDLLVSIKLSLKFLGGLYVYVCTQLCHNMRGRSQLCGFFPPPLHGFCNQTLVVRHASPSIKFHYPLSHGTTPTLQICYYCVQTCTQSTWELVLFPLSFSGTELGPSSLHPPHWLKLSHGFLLIPEVNQSITEFCTRNHWNWSN